jgi:phage protein U
MEIEYRTDWNRLGYVLGSFTLSRIAKRRENFATEGGPRRTSYCTEILINLLSNLCQIQILSHRLEKMTPNQNQISMRIPLTKMS